MLVNVFHAELHSLMCDDLSRTNLISTPVPLHVFLQQFHRECDFHLDVVLVHQFFSCIAIQRTTAVLLSFRYSRLSLAVTTHLAIPREIARVPNSPSHNWMSAADLHTLSYLQPVSHTLTCFSTAWTARSVTPFARRSRAGEFATTV